MSQLSPVFCIAHELSHTIATMTAETLPISHIEDVGDLIIVLFEELWIRVAAAAIAIFSTTMMTIHYAQDAILLNKKIIDERGFFSMATLRVNLLFIAVIVIAAVSQVLAVFEPHTVYSVLKMHDAVTWCCTQILSEIPASLEALGDRLNADFSSLVAMQERMPDWREKLSCHMGPDFVQHGKALPETTFTNFDWRIFEGALMRSIVESYGQAAASVAMATIGKSARDKFFTYFQNVYTMAQKDLVDRQIYRVAAFEEEDTRAMEAKNNIATLFLCRSAVILGEGLVVTDGTHRYFISPGSVNDPLHGISGARGFGIPVGEEGLYHRMLKISEDIRKLMTVPGRLELLRDLLQNEFVERSEIASLKVPPMDPIIASELQSFYERQGERHPVFFVPGSSGRTIPLQVAGSAQQIMVPEAFAPLVHAAAANAGLVVQPVASEIDLEVQRKAEITEARRLLEAQEKLRAAPREKESVVSLYESISRDLSQTEQQTLRNLLFETPANQRKERNKKVQKILARVNNLFPSYREGLYTLLSPRKDLDPSLVMDPLIREAFKHITTLSRLIEQYVLQAERVSPSPA